MPVANRPVLFHGLDLVASVGITEVGIVVSAPGSAIRAAVGDGSRFGLKVTYIPQDKPLGLAHCVMIARDFLGDSDFLMYLGDNIFIGGVTEAFEQFREARPAAQLVLAKVADPCQSGVAELDESGRVAALEEKPSHPKSDLAVTGAYFFTPRIHDAVGSITPSWRNELEITDALQWLVSAGDDVRGHVFAGLWKDTGTVADLLDCNMALLERVQARVDGTVDAASSVSGQVVIEPGAEVVRSVLRGPLIIGAGSRVEDSYIGPFTSIGSGCTLRQARVEYSILLDLASVHGVGPVQGSIIGQAGDIRPHADGATAHRLLVGDDSVIEVPA